jgi:hypothetical protein
MVEEIVGNMVGGKRKSILSKSERKHLTPASACISVVATSRSYFFKY